MKRNSKMTKILIVVVILVISLTSTAAAEQTFNSEILKGNLLDSQKLEDLQYVQDTEKAKEAINVGTEVVGKIKEETDKYVKTNVSSKYTKSDDQVLTKVKIKYEDVNGNRLHSDVIVNVKLGDYTEKAIPIEGFKFVSKGKTEVSGEEYEWLIVFKYEKVDKDPVDPGKEDPVDPGKEDPVDPGKEDPVDPGKEDPVDPGKEDPKAPDKEEPKAPEKPKTDDTKKVATTQEKLPKAGSSMAGLYVVGGLMTVSGGMLLRKKK